MQTRIIMALRYKIIAAFIIFLIAGLILTGMTYQRHVVIRDRLEVIEDVDDLINNALEVRRYEKNFFLYGGRENYDFLLKYLTTVEQKLNNLEISAIGPNGSDMKSYLDELLKSYRESVLRYGAMDLEAEKPAEAEILADKIRTLGHNFTEEMRQLVKLERNIVNRLVAGQKNSLFIAFTLFLLLTVTLAYYLYFQIFAPLSRIERAAQDVIEGQVQEIPHFGGSTEIQSLTGALNLMIKELEKKGDQLIQREKMAALGTLTSGVAHELNNPLSNISSSTQILLEELETSEPSFQIRMLEGIEQQVEKARDIVKSLLEFAREKEFEPLPTNLLTLVEKVVKLIKGEVPKDVDIAVNIPPDLEMEIDQRRFSQALMNLMINGMQAMENSGGLLSIGAAPHMEDNEVLIWIEDEGAGIPAENQGKIFDPFFSTKDVGEGTGLGLYMTYGIIQKHGGRIEAVSQEGVGTRFNMTIPARQPREHSV